MFSSHSNSGLSSMLALLAGVMTGCSDTGPDAQGDAVGLDPATPPAVGTGAATGDLGAAVPSTQVPTTGSAIVPMPGDDTSGGGDLGGGAPAAGDPVVGPAPDDGGAAATSPPMTLPPVDPDISVDLDLPPSRPLGAVPNEPYPESLVGLPRDDWAQGLISPTLASTHDNQPSVINGYLQLTGNARFSTYDIQDPTRPQLISERVSPDNCDTCGPAGEGEAEGHQVAFAKYGDQLLTATISGLGIDLWNITDPVDPQYLQSVHFDGVNFGDFTEAVWGIYWQGNTIYVGGTNTGLHVLDATDPGNVSIVNRLPTSALGGVSAGPVYAVGNILVVTTPKESGGIATLEISDPHNPFLLDAIQTTASYIGALYRHHLYLQSPLRVWDVLSDPTDIGAADAPLGTLETEASEYMSFSDDFMFLGLLRPNPGAAKINVTSPSQMEVTNRIWGRLNLSENDDQFTVAIGNLLVLSDDQLLGGGGRAGTVIAVHAANPDTTPPMVDTIIPRDGATGVSPQSRIGLSFSDNIELATVDPRSMIVRPVGGQPVAGTWGVYAGVLNFDPQSDLQPGTSYEVVLPAGRLTDYVGNGIAADFSSTFTTR